MIESIDKLRTLVVGTVGVGASANAQEAIDHTVTAFPDLGTIQTGLGTITQIIILLATLWGLFKKKKPANPVTPTE